MSLLFVFIYFYSLRFLCWCPVPMMEKLRLQNCLLLSHRRWCVSSGAYAQAVADASIHEKNKWNNTNIQHVCRFAEHQCWIKDNRQTIYTIFCFLFLITTIVRLHCFVTSDIVVVDLCTTYDVLYFALSVLCGWR